MAADQRRLVQRVIAVGWPLTRKGLPSRGPCLQFPLLVDLDHAY